MAKLTGKARDRARKKANNKSKNNLFLRKKSLIDSIVKYDASILEKESQLVSHGEDVVESIKKMTQVLNATKNGIGLSASQIGIDKKIIIIKSNTNSTQITCMINPEIISHSEEMKIGRESCLSYPGITGYIERYTSVEVSYYDVEWNKHTVKYKNGDILSVVVQHEIEHISKNHCQIFDWWKDPEGKKKELEERMKFPEELIPEELKEGFKPEEKKEVVTKPLMSNK